MPLPSVADRVREVIVEQLGIEPAEIVPIASLVDDLGADSLDRIELVTALEEYFDISITDEDGDSFRTVADIIVHVERQERIKASHTEAES